MTKITRIADILNGTGVERDRPMDPMTAGEWDASAMRCEVVNDSPHSIMVEGHEVKSGQRYSWPVKRVRNLLKPADRYVQYGEAKVTVRPGETFADAWTREGR